MRHEVIVVKTVFDHLARLGVEVGKQLDDRDLDSLLVEKGDVGIDAADGEEPSRLERVVKGAVLGRGFSSAKTSPASA